MTSAEHLPESAVSDLLREAPLEIEGRLSTASNLTLRCRVEGTQLRCVYKPTSGERPLWDFPDGTLGGREVATYTLARALGWDIIPVTVWREDGPLGSGMCQLWLDDAVAESLVDVVPTDQIPPGWHRVFDGVDNVGRQVSLVHADRLDLQRIALLDAVVNNTDRKGGHVLLDPGGVAMGIDHGVTFAEENKLRTVLWGWAGQAIPAPLQADLQGLQQQLSGLSLPSLTIAEIAAASSRLATLLDAGAFPMPSEDWPSIPWPIF